MFRKILNRLAIFAIDLVINALLVAVAVALYCFYVWFHGQPVVPSFDLDAVTPKMGQ